jgi:hypothetical protein
LEDQKYLDFFYLLFIDEEDRKILKLIIKEYDEETIVQKLLKQRGINNND